MSQNKIKNLVLTGASRGIGHATVKRFSSAGWRVITCSREKVPEKCPWSEGLHDHVQIDLESVENIVEGSKKIVEKYKIPIRYIEGASNIETVTPTGLSILASIANFDRSINIKPSNFGVGLGTKNFEKFPNVLTVTLGSDNPKENIVSMKTLLETNIDDMSPEIAGSLIDQAHSLGALDCWISNYYGKKNRPGMTFHILCENIDRDKFSSFIFENTSSLGFRVIQIEREETERSTEELDSSFGKIKIKFKYLKILKLYLV